MSLSDHADPRENFSYALRSSGCFTAASCYRCQCVTNLLLSLHTAARCRFCREHGRKDLFQFCRCANLFELDWGGVCGGFGCVSRRRYGLPASLSLSKARRASQSSRGLRAALVVCARQPVGCVAAVGFLVPPQRLPASRRWSHVLKRCGRGVEGLHHERFVIGTAPQAFVHDPGGDVYEEEPAVPPVTHVQRLQVLSGQESGDPHWGCSVPDLLHGRLGGRPTPLGKSNGVVQRSARAPSDWVCLP